MVLNVVGAEKGLLHPVVVGIGMEDEIHKFPQQCGLVSMSGQIILAIPRSRKKTQNWTYAVVPGCHLSLREAGGQKGMAQLMHGGRLRQLLFDGEKI